MRISQRKYEYFLVLCMIFSIALENIKLFSIFGAPFKPSHIVFILAILHVFLINKAQITISHFILLIFYLALPVFPLYRIKEPMEWFKSYVIWVLCVVYLFLGYGYCNKIFQTNRIKLVKLIIDVIMITQILGIIQFVLMNYFGVMFLKDSFGAFQFSVSFVSSKNGIWRAFSVYHEPSVLGWISSTQFAILFFTKDEKIISSRYWYFCVVTCVLAMFVSVSATGMFLILGLIAIYLLLNVKKRRTFFSIIVAVCVFFIVWNYTDLAAPLRRFVSEYDTVNSSGYERFNAPMQYAIKTLQVYPLFGRGIGISGATDLVGILTSSNYETANNSIYQVIMNFGLTSVFLFVPLVQFCLKSIGKNKKYILIVFNLLGVLIATGAYLSLDFLVVLNISMFLFYPISDTKTSDSDLRLEG